MIPSLLGFRNPNLEWSVCCFLEIQELKKVLKYFGPKVRSVWLFQMAFFSPSKWSEIPMMKNVDICHRPYKVTLTRLHVKALAVGKNMHESLDYFEPGAGCVKK